MKRAIVDYQDGTVGIMCPAEECELTLDEIVAKDLPDHTCGTCGTRQIKGDGKCTAMARDEIAECGGPLSPNGATFEIVNTIEIPADRTFRDAWKRKPGGVEVDMPRARDMHMAEIRRKRDARLVVLDQRRFGSEYDTERQTLSDIPANFDLEAAGTPEALKALMPPELQ